MFGIFKSKKQYDYKLSLGGVGGIKTLEYGNNLSISSVPH